MGLGFGTSKQSSTSYSGLRGTDYFTPFAGQFAATGNQLAKTSREYAKSPFGFFQGKSVDEIAPTVNGLPPEVQGYMNTFANQQFAKSSAGGSFRGQNSPENTQGIVGSSLNNIGSFLTPYIMDYAKYRQQLPEQLMASRLGFLQNTLGAMSPGVGSESKYTGKSLNVDSGLSANFGMSA